jgi:phosphoglycolate phosphatase-like HAD superfamily hydrolase
MKRAVIFDVDGTLCDVRSIRHLLRASNNFHAFHMASIDCPPHQWVVDAAREVHAAGDAVLIVTARDWKYRNLTAFWLAMHDVPSDAMWMRRSGDPRPDHLVKADILKQIRRSFDPVHAYDDRPTVCDLWKRNRIPVTVVPGWEDTP